ncbi:DUF6896 domain-containing protein [Cellulomonas oligotrophica]|uniref:DUF6896 domain-containing protein n=1 Tax=Cellulomonas oligotrophica TaxID=931536 RepID=UPI0033754235
MTPDQIISAFIRDLALCKKTLVENFLGAERLRPGVPLVFMKIRSGSKKRSGRIGGVGMFELHGQGCRFELESGATVDFDWDAQGREIFDAWRLCRFARSLGEEHIASGSILDAALGDSRLQEVKPGWFAVACDRED